jgi:hypothetical protein
MMSIKFKITCKLLAAIAAGKRHMDELSNMMDESHAHIG